MQSPVGFKYMTWVANLAVPVSIILPGIGAYKGLREDRGWDASQRRSCRHANNRPFPASLMVGTFACGTGGGSCYVFKGVAKPLPSGHGRSCYLRRCIRIFDADRYDYFPWAGTTRRGTGFRRFEHAVFLRRSSYCFLTWTTCDTDYYASSWLFLRLRDGKSVRSHHAHHFLCIGSNDPLLPSI